VVDFGVFLPIGNNGWILSENSPQYRPTFDLNRQITQRAEEFGFGFVLSMVKFRGNGGITKHWDYCLDSFALMTGLAAVTSKIKLYASCSPITMHPALVARMAATAQDVSDGRFGINIVAGWNKNEYAQMGMWPGAEFYSYRYDYASEYVHIMRELWETGSCTFHGKYFDVDDCMCLPMPPSPIEIVSAGFSPRGKQFIAEYADFHFGAGQNVEQALASNKLLFSEAAKTGRKVGAFATASLVIADTDEEAQARVMHYAAGADIEAIDYVTAQYALDTAKDGSSASIVANSTKTDGPRSAYYGGNWPVAGSPETIARHIDALSSAPGTVGIMLTFDDFIDGLERFGTEVMPLLECRAAV
jgi:pyrimidine oxygenase